MARPSRSPSQSNFPRLHSELDFIRVNWVRISDIHSFWQLGRYVKLAVLLNHPSPVELFPAVQEDQATSFSVAPPFVSVSSSIYLPFGQSIAVFRPSSLWLRRVAVNLNTSRLNFEGNSVIVWGLGDILHVRSDRPKGGWLGQSTTVRGQRRDSHGNINISTSSHWVEEESLREAIQILVWRAFRPRFGIASYSRFPEVCSDLIQKEHLETQSKNVLSRLYQKPASCLAIFRYYCLLRTIAEVRLLTPLAKHVVLTMLYNPEPVSIVDFDTWFASDSTSKQYCPFPNK